MSTRSHQLCRCVRTFLIFSDCSLSGEADSCPLQKIPPWAGASPSLRLPLCRFARGLAQVCARRSPSLHSAPCKLAPRRFQSCAPPAPNLHSEWAIGGLEERSCGCSSGNPPIVLALLNVSQPAVDDDDVSVFNRLFDCCTISRPVVVSE